MKEEILKRKKEILEKVSTLNKKEPEEEKKTKKPLVTSRVLFISVLDKIYLIILILFFIKGTCNIFNGDIGSLNYHFFLRVGEELIFILITALIYLILNWIYKCAVKTILCVTEKEVYKESYFPFKRTETTVPLEKITKVTTINLFYIFRTVIIHQYQAFPIIFMTWNNQEFKDKVKELITNDKSKIENEYENKNILTKSMYKYVGYAGVGLAIIILLLGIIRLFNYITNEEKNIPGTYTSKRYEITINEDGTCKLKNIVNNARNCEWVYNKDTKEVVINYYYYYYSRDSITLEYNKKEKSLKYKETTLTK